LLEVWLDHEAVQVREAAVDVAGQQEFVGEGLIVLLVVLFKSAVVEDGVTAGVGGCCGFSKEGVEELIGVG
jgi:hypothetical protein